MQQSKALYFLNLFFNFIVQNQKILETTSNFRISLDLFVLATFGTNYNLQTANKAITGCTKVAQWYFFPFLAKHRLEMIDILVFFCENLTLQNALGAKAQRIRIRGFCWPLFVRNEVKNLLFKLFYNFLNYYNYSITIG